VCFNGLKHVKMSVLGTF